MRFGNVSGSLKPNFTQITQYRLPRVMLLNKITRFKIGTLPERH
ncbi:hypothetical protein [Alysiella filiformis]|uniref:Uncharacterized protein n=1 Tax=Alysiella filiformis DSM 16848 TaxID=1120981 RepID=A0A286E6E8_9NEIS|nr:hypothetical protein [Alysiella filiformis]SOD66495.1 hypothetical protein SAMN02746062_00626 [Alysiella filiformis DSM 16848]